MSSFAQIKVAERFQRSIRIDTDINHENSLSSYICAPSSAEVLEQVARHISQTGQGAFSWTGPYGSGKSSLLIEFGALIGKNAKHRELAKKAIGTRTANKVYKSLPLQKTGWRVVPVVGRREPPTSVIGDALVDAGHVSPPDDEWTEAALLETLANLSTTQPKTYGGLAILVDEFGKFLEGASLSSSDIYLFQQIAELASRSNGRLLFIGALHQSFSEYASGQPQIIQDEWAKIQGRFIDLSVNSIGEEQIALIGSAIQKPKIPAEHSEIVNAFAGIIRENRPSASGELEKLLTQCWPLHPASALLLGPISRRRYGQNQRSIFGFLNSAEPAGFQDFLAHAGSHEVYEPARLWDYLSINLGHTIMASGDSHKWATAADTISRAESSHLGGSDIKLLKTIAILDLFREQSGAYASEDLLFNCIAEIKTKKSLRDALSRLEAASLIILKRYLGGYTVYEGSDFDIDDAVSVALQNIGEISIEDISQQIHLSPICAKRHLHETGAMRWFGIELCAVSNLSEFSLKHTNASANQAGNFILAIPTDGESDSAVREICRTVARGSEQANCLIGYSNYTLQTSQTARELVALRLIRESSSELAGDPVARKEVSSRISALEQNIESDIDQAFNNASWYQKGKPAKTLMKREMNALASDICDSLFPNAPVIQSELLNRTKPSSSAVAAQNTLLRHMIQYENEFNLAIRGFPAERGLYEVLLGATNIHRKIGDEWRFAAPHSKNDPAHLNPLWEGTLKLLKSRKSGLISLTEIYEYWASPPFGVKRGLMPFLATAFILANKRKVAFYRESIFQSEITDLDVDYLVRDPNDIQLRWMNLSDVTRNLLKEMSGVVTSFSSDSDAKLSEPIDIARSLINIYTSTSHWTKRTTRLSENARKVRTIFKKASDPNAFLFEDLPAKFSIQENLVDPKSIKSFASNIRDALSELVESYPAMLHEVRRTLLIELDVLSASESSLKEIRSRAQNILGISGDFRLEAFISRLAHFKGTDSDVEGVISLAVSRPPQDWADTDIDKALVEIAKLAEEFVNLEAYAHVKGRPDNRTSIAVVVGNNGRRQPSKSEISVSKRDEIEIAETMNALKMAIENNDSKRPQIKLAALARLAAEYISSEPALHQTEIKERKDG